MSDCPKNCGHPHITHRGHPSCTGHVSPGRPGDPPKPRAGLPCGHEPMRGQAVCRMHGGAAKQARRAGAERHLEARLHAKLGDAGDRVTDPLGALLDVAGRAIRFMELVGQLVDDLDAIRFRDAKGAEHLRSEVAVYERAISRAAATLEGVVRLGIEDRLVKIGEAEVAKITAFLDAVLADLGHDPRSPEIASVVLRRLKLVS